MSMTIKVIFPMVKQLVIFFLMMKLFFLPLVQIGFEEIKDKLQTSFLGDTGC